MIYHFMGNSPFCQTFIDFMVENNKHYDLSEHFFVINNLQESNFEVELLEPVQHIMLKAKWGFVSVLNKISTQDKLIIHGLFNPRLLACLFINRKMINKCIWSIWGGDVYFYKLKKNSFKYNLIEFMRKSVIPDIPIITAMVKGDYEAVRRVYDTKAEYIYSAYPNVVNLENTFDLELHAKNGVIKTIMIGNSGDPSNNHSEIFAVLNRFKGEDVRIICPLSYGNADYIDQTIKNGAKVFGSQFVPLTKFLSPEEYVKILVDVDVAVMNHNRQQALGNILLLLALGKKVYIREETSHFQFFIENNITVFGVQDFKRVDLADIFTVSSEIGEKNKVRIKQLFSGSNYIKMWDEVFKVNVTW